MKLLNNILALAQFQTIICSTVQFSLTGHHDYKTLPRMGLPTARQLQDIGYRYGGDTETWDTWRYSRSSLPLSTRFTDSENVSWQVTLHGKHDQVSFVVPISRELIFYGDERDRVGVDAKCRWAELSFYYQEASGWWISKKSHGIRVKTRCYIDSTDGSTDNMGYWTEALKLVKQGSEIAVDLSKAYANLKGRKQASGSGNSAPGFAYIPSVRNWGIIKGRK